MRIYDNPNHPHYGPARRLWVILAQLDLLETAEATLFKKKRKWDEQLAKMLDKDNAEPSAQVAVLIRVFKHED